MRISDWSSDVCSSDHEILVEYADGELDLGALRQRASEEIRDDTHEAMDRLWEEEAVRFGTDAPDDSCAPPSRNPARPAANRQVPRSEEHTSELQPLMRLSYAVFGLKKKKQSTRTNRRRQR